MPEDGQLRPLDLVEDELVLAVPWCRCRPTVKQSTRTGHRAKKEEGQPVCGVGSTEETIAAGLSSAAAAKRKCAGRWRPARRYDKQIEPSLEQSHGCAEIPCHPVPPRHASCPRRPEPQAAVDDPTTGEVHLRHHHCRRFLPRQEGHPDRPRPSKKIDVPGRPLPPGGGAFFPGVPVIGGPRNRKHDEQADLFEDRGHR